MAGAFFAFSVFIMRALGRLPAPQGIAAMQSINIAALNPWFMGAFVGTAAACIATTVCAFLGWKQPGAVWLLAGSALYLFGTFGVTVAFNVPLNDALAAAKPNSAEAANLWADYLVSWTWWNHVRTLAAVAALGAFIIALLKHWR